MLPKHLDEKVARLQLSKLGAQLTELSDDRRRTSAWTRRVCTSPIRTGIDASSSPSGGGAGVGALPALPPP